MTSNNKFYLYHIKNTAMIRVFAIMVFTALFSSCSFIKLKQDLKEMNDHTGLRGEITIKNKNPNAPYIIAAFNKKNQLVKYKLIQSNSDYYVFQLKDSKVYRIAIFKDLNRNSVYDNSEPAAFWMNSENKLLLKNQNKILNFNLSSKTTIPKILRINPSDAKLFSGATFKVATGQKTNFKHYEFSREYGNFALWQPFEAFRKYGIGVYFMNDFDPQKIPILCVYGMGGFASDWKTLFNSIDTSKFQPWFYQYPSGYSIDASAKALNIIMKKIRDKYKFKQLYILAHSMGGLVAEKFIQLSRPSKKLDHFITLFITISTPWAGDKDAEWGQKAPATIPCWNDIVPSSAFIKSLNAADLNEIPYYLLFTYKGDRKPFRINNDTTISIASQLKMDFQLKAKKIYGFNDHHAAILKDDKAISIINSILNTK